MSNLAKKAMCKTCTKQLEYFLASEAKPVHLAIVYFPAVEKYPFVLVK
jgi:hypothetical protein